MKTITVKWLTLLDIWDTVIEANDGHSTAFMQTLLAGLGGHGDTKFQVTIEEIDEDEAPPSLGAGGAE